MKRNSGMKMAALFLILAVSWIGYAYSEPVTGFGPLNRTVFLSDTALIANDNSTVWVDAFSTTIHARDYQQCVALMYSGEVFTNSSGQFRALIDDKLAEGGTAFLAYSSNNLFETRSMNWWICGLERGDHVVKIQFRPFSDNRMGVRNRTLIVQILY